MKRYPQFIRHDVLQVDLARGIGMDYERIRVTRCYSGEGIYVQLDRPRTKELHAAASFLLARRPYGVRIVIAEAHFKRRCQPYEALPTKLTLLPDPWETSEVQRHQERMYHEHIISLQSLYDSLKLPDVLLRGTDPSGLQAQAQS